MSATNSFQDIFHFNERDLAANREGQLSSEQLHRLKQAFRADNRHSATRPILGLAFTSFFLLVTGLSLFQLNNTRASTNPTLVLVVGFLFVLWLALAFFELRILQVLMMPPQPQVRRVDGYLVLGNAIGQDRNSDIEIEMDGKKLAVPLAAKPLFDVTKPYAVYQAVYKGRGVNKVVSLEETDPTAVADNAAIKSPLEYERQTLQRIFGFTEADLVFNRAGKLSPAQCVTLGQSINNMARNGIVVSFVVGLFSLFGCAGLTQNLWLTAVLTLAILALFLFLTTSSPRQQRRNLPTTEVKMVSGPVSVIITSDLRHVGSSSALKTVTVYNLRIGDLQKTVDWETYLAFKDGMPYNVYFVPSLMLQPIIAAEQLS